MYTLKCIHKLLDFLFSMLNCNDSKLNYSFESFNFDNWSEKLERDQSIDFIENKKKTNRSFVLKQN